MVSYYLKRREEERITDLMNNLKFISPNKSLFYNSGFIGDILFILVPYINSSIAATPAPFSIFHPALERTTSRAPTVARSSLNCTNPI